MQQIQDIVNEKVKTMVEDGTIVSIVETSVEKAITKALETQFESWGTITKQIEEALKEGLKINMKDVPLDTYNEQMLVAVKARIGNLFQGTAANKFMEEMDKVLEPAPKEISMQELVESIAGFWKTDEPWDADDLDEYATVEIDRHEDLCLSGISLKMWKQKESRFCRDNSEDIILYINDTIRINHKHDYNPTCFKEVEAFVFKLYAAGTIITGIENFDADDCDLTLKDLDC